MVMKRYDWLKRYFASLKNGLIFVEILVVKLLTSNFYLKAFYRFEWCMTNLRRPKPHQIFTVI